MRRPVPVSPAAAGARFLRGIVAVSVAAVLVAACSAAGAGSSSAAQSVGAATDSPSALGTVPAASLPEATGVATNLDPCQVVTQQAASQLAGTTFGAGKEETTQGHGKTCTYGAGTTDVFMVVVGQAPDVATAQAEEAAMEQKIKTQTSGLPLNIVKLSGIGDGAVFLSFSQALGGKTISGSAVYALKGTVFFGFSDLKVGGAAPSQSAMVAQAQAIAGQLP